jgi:hypothetical protein
MKTLKLFAVILLALFFSQCKYDFIVPEEVIDPTDPNVEVISFSNEIVPIFTDLNCIACHTTGATAPDLTSANAYSSIVPSYVNLDNPEESEILTKPGPSSSHPKKYSEAQAALILTWIVQGAENN